MSTGDVTDCTMRIGKNSTGRLDLCFCRTRSCASTSDHHSDYHLLSLRTGRNFFQAMMMPKFLSGRNFRAFEMNAKIISFFGPSVVSFHCLSLASRGLIICFWREIHHRTAPSWRSAGCLLPCIGTVSLPSALHSYVANLVVACHRIGPPPLLPAAAVPSCPSEASPGSRTS